jgi:hypothetical protein
VGDGPTTFQSVQWKWAYTCTCRADPFKNNVKCLRTCALQIRSLDAATNVGPDQLLDLHNEMCYNPKPNKKIILICLKPAKEVRLALCPDKRTQGSDQGRFAWPFCIRVRHLQDSTLWSWLYLVICLC